jgi:hypothetical protein
MPYQAEISRDNPTCFLFVIDQSGSMDEITETGRSKADFVADVLNKTLYTLVTSCSKSDGVRNYFDVGVIAYGGSEVTTGFGGALSGSIVHPINAISEHTLRIEERQKKVDDGAGGILELKTKFPVWFDPKSLGGTPMRAAFGKTRDTPRLLPADHSARDRRSIDRRRAGGSGGRPAEDFDQRRRGAAVQPARNHRGRAGSRVSDLRNGPQRRVFSDAVPDVEPVAGTSCQVCR